MSQRLPWEGDPHYLPRLAACAAGLRSFLGEALAVHDIRASVGGYVRSPEEVLDSPLVAAGASPAEVEDQMAIVAHVHAEAVPAAVDVLRHTFNLLEDLGPRPIVGLQRSRRAWVAILPPFGRPSGWPQQSGSGYPTTFTVEIVGYAADHDLGRVFVASWTSPDGGLRFRNVEELDG